MQIEIEEQSGRWTITGTEEAILLLVGSALYGTETFLLNDDKSRPRATQNMERNKEAIEALAKQINLNPAT